MIPPKTKKKNCKVKDARRILREQEAQKLIDMDQVTDEAIENAEQNGIIFIDEIDKIASGSRMTSGADVSREGVQRDILPIVEGSVINTKYGPVRTDHILFIGAGCISYRKADRFDSGAAGTFPDSCDARQLEQVGFVEILTKPENALIKQHKALLETEGIEVEFTEGAHRPDRNDLLYDERPDRKHRCQTTAHDSRKAAGGLSFNILERMEIKLTSERGLCQWRDSRKPSRRRS